MHLIAMAGIMLFIAIFYKEGKYINSIDDTLIYFITPGEDKEDAIIEERFNKINTKKANLKVYRGDDPVQNTIHHNLNIDDINKITKQILEIA